MMKLRAACRDKQQEGEMCRLGLRRFRTDARVWEICSRMDELTGTNLQYHLLEDLMVDHDWIRGENGIHIRPTTEKKKNNKTAAAERETPASSLYKPRIIKIVLSVQEPSSIPLSILQAFWNSVEEKNSHSMMLPQPCLIMDTVFSGKFREASLINALPVSLDGCS